jgi:hypothetical protein
MNADTMAEWMRRQGLRVVCGAGSYWVEVVPHIYQAFPYHWLIRPDDNELKEMHRSLRAAGMRYSAPLDSPEGMVSYHVVHSGKDYSLDHLPQKARYDVRKGLGSFKVEPMSLGRLAAEGWELRHETLIRQRRTQAEPRCWWERLCLSADGLPGVECWGATDIRTGKLVSSLFAFTCDNCFSILYQQSRTDSLRLGVNNVLLFIVTQEVLKRREINEIFYGLHSLDAPPSVDAFKFRMGFRAKPVRQRVVFHPWLTPFVLRLGHRAVRRLLRLKPEHPLFAKAEGMLRFSIEGKRPLAEQQWPEALAEDKTGLLHAQEL